MAGPSGPAFLYNFYPRSPCGERLAALYLLTAFVCISIHALLAESDGGFVVGSWPRVIFLSTLSLRRATLLMCFWPCGLLFLSTLSLRRATIGQLQCIPGGKYFYPRSPCGERRRRSVKLFRQNYISIHALLAESDVFGFCLSVFDFLFLSTLSLRRATHYDNYNLHCVEISIHALLAESDPSSTVIVILRKNFYPRSPCGERPL